MKIGGLNNDEKNFKICIKKNNLTTENAATRCAGGESFRRTSALFRTDVDTCVEARNQN